MSNFAANDRIGVTGDPFAERLGAVRWEASGDAFELCDFGSAERGVLGYSRDEAHAPGFCAAIVHPDDREFALRQRRRCAAGAGPTDIEVRLRAHDGQWRWFRELAAKVTDDDGRTRLTGLWVDIDENKRTEDLLRAERTRLRNILEATEVGAWEWNCQTGATVFDEAWPQMLGYTLEELSPTSFETWTKLVHPDDLRRAQDELERHFGGRADAYECEFRMRRKDGGWTWILARGRVLTRTEDGQPLLMFGTQTDITARKLKDELFRANAAMLEGLTKLQRECLVESDPRAWFQRVLDFALETTASEYGFVGEVSLDDNGTPQLQNYAVTDISCDSESRAFYAQSAPAGMVFSKLDSLFGAVMTTRRVVIANEPANDPRRGGLPAGHPPLHSFLGLPLYVGDELIGVLGIANRVGGYDEPLVERLAPLIATCGSMVHSHRLARQRRQAQSEQRKLEDQLQQAQKLESLGILAGGIAHDFNNLLTGILGRAELALSTLGEQDAAREHIARALVGAERASELVDQLLAYAGRARGAATPIDLTALAGEIQRLLELSMPKRCSLRTELTRELPAVRGDATQLRQVLMNLVLNAGEATRDAEGEVIVRTGVAHYGAAELAEYELGHDLASGSYVHVEVSDNGVGMPPETRARIFEPFFTTKFAGRGLGLSAVLGIVRSHGGAIRCDSAPGGGSTFRILLPASSAESHADALREVGAGPREASPLDKLVMVVDDDELVLTVARRMLESLGCRVVTAADGPEALQRYEEFGDSLDVIVLDLTMPRVDGEDVLHELQARNARSRIVLTSGYDEQSLATRFADEGIAGFLHKPYTRAKLLNVLRRALA